MFSEELKSLKDEITQAKHYKEQNIIAHGMLSNILGNIDVSVDVHQHSASWACISIQGKRSDYIKFVDLGNKDVREIQSFLRSFERSGIIRKVDAAPQVTNYLKIDS